jgi:uncharacterized membrane protein
MSDLAHRSFIKAISRRITGTIDTIIVSFFVALALTGHPNFKLSFSIGFVELFTKIALYYVHERVWNRIQFGRAKPGQDYQI